MANIVVVCESSGYLHFSDPLASGPNRVGRFGPLAKGSEKCQFIMYLFKVIEKCTNFYFGTGKLPPKF